MSSDQGDVPLEVPEPETDPEKALDPPKRYGDPDFKQDEEAD